MVKIDQSQVATLLPDFLVRQRWYGANDLELETVEIEAISGSDELQVEGAAQEVKGGAQKVVGDAKAATKKAANDAADFVNKKL